MTRLLRLHAMRLCVALTLVTVVVLGVLIWLRTVRVEESAPLQKQIVSPYRPVPMAVTQRPTALFVGDDFTAGYGGVGRNAYPYTVCASLGLNCNVDAQTDTGLVSAGRGWLKSSSRLIDRLPTDRMLYNADVVIVDAGRNDLEVAPAAYGQALQQYLDEVKQLWPDAKIAVIAPSYMSAEPDPGYGDRISIVNQITHSFGGALIDPVAEGWYEGVDIPAMEIPEGTFPNQIGHSFIAKKLAHSLLSHGIGQPGVID